MFNDFLTTEGERLLAKSIAGTATITFTKMELGDGDRGTSTKAITSLESKRMTLDIYSVLLTGDNHIEITTILDSEAIPDGFYFREKGIYATDGTTEILFMYGTSGSLGEWMENVDSAVFTRTIRTIVTLSESDNVNITIQKGAYASGQDAENILTAIQDIKVNGDWAKYSQAENILSILDNLVASYTALRAGKLDNLDALISSRAPANTALSNATWTNARAALLDNLDAKISSRAQASTALSNATWTNARAGYLDSLTRLGQPADTGGSTTAGTIMAKLNELIANVDLLRKTNGYYKPSNNLKYNFVSSELSCNDINKSLKLGAFYANKSGCIRVVASLKGSDGKGAVYIGIPKYSESSSAGGIEYIGTPKVSSVNFYEIENNSTEYQVHEHVSVTEAARVAATTSSTYELFDKTVWVEQGEYIAFYLGPHYQGHTAYCNKLQVFFDEVIL